MGALDTYPSWIFDGSDIPDPLGHGQRAVDFLKMLCHPKSTAPGRAFVLDLWLERIVRRIYGPRHPDGTRIVKTVPMLLPRSNRKTTIAAALALLHAIGPERVNKGEIAFAAADRKQAKIAYREALSFAQATPELEPLISAVDSKNAINVKFELPGGLTHESIIEALSCDAGTQHGRSSSFVLIDEIHAWKKPDLYGILKTGLFLKAKDPLLLITTTAGRGQDNLAFDIIDLARKVARGDIDDPSMLPILFETDPDEDWRNEAVWRRVNPGLACSPPYQTLEGLQQLARDAENRPNERDEFRQLVLNTWLDYSAAPFVEMAIYNKCDGKVDLEELEDRPCWLAVDLSTNKDLTAVVAAWRDDNDGYIVYPWFFCPKDNLHGRASKDGVPYPAWAQDGFIITTPGNSIDYAVIENFIRDLCKRFDVREIAFDPWNANQVTSNLSNDGFTVYEHRQGFQSMNPPIRELERVLIGGKLKHGGHPILRWNFSNIAVNCPPFGPDIWRKQEGSRISLRTGLCRRTISASR